jgi:hypothetical protein
VRKLLRRMLYAALLDADTYEEVEADHQSIGQATLVVALASTSFGLGTAIQSTSAGIAGVQLAFQIAISALLPSVLWFAGSAFAFMTGASFFRGPETETDFAEVLRTTGFAFTPGLLLVFSCLPPATLGLGIYFLTSLWIVVAGVVAIRQALDFTTARAVGTFGSAMVLLWLVVWGLSVVPLPL